MNNQQPIKAPKVLINVKKKLEELLTKEAVNEDEMMRKSINRHFDH